jgi:hypothetical protein
MRGETGGFIENKKTVHAEIIVSHMNGLCLSLVFQRG